MGKDTNAFVEFMDTLRNELSNVSLVAIDPSALIEVEEGAREDERGKILELIREYHASLPGPIVYDEGHNFHVGGKRVACGELAHLIRERGRKS